MSFGVLLDTALWGRSIDAKPGLRVFDPPLHPPGPTQSLPLLGAKYRTVPPGLAELAFSKKVMTLVCWEIL